MELRLNVPPQPALVQERVASALAAVRGRSDFSGLLTYDTTAGRPRDRELAAQWLRRLLGRVSADDVVIGAGGAAVLAGLVTTFTDPGDTIVTEALTYPGIRAVCRHFGRTLTGVATDGEGMIPVALAEACERLRPKLLYCTPTIQNPTTATMSQQRRAEIVAVARQFDLIVIEDDAYGMLPSEPLAPLATIAPERTYYIASLSKCLSPGLRIAYCAGPEAGRVEMTEGVRVVSFLASPLTVALASQLIEDGSAMAILDAIRSECAARQVIARQVFEGEAIAAHAHGPHLWLPLAGTWKIPELGEHLRANGVAAKGDGFAVDGEHPQALRACLGAAPSREALIRGLEFLKQTVREGPSRVN